MSRLDRYIARQYLINVLALFVILFSFVVAIDAGLNLDRFIDRADELGTTNGEPPSGLRRGVLTATLVVDLWWPRLVQLYNYLLGIIMVGATGFTLSQMVRHRELVAIMASGQSLRRVAVPILAVSVVLTGVQLVSAEVFIPKIAPLIPRDHGQAGTRDLGATRLLLVPDAQGRLFSAARFDAARDAMIDVHIMERDGDGILTRHITADRADAVDRGWRLTGGSATTPGSEGTAAAAARPVDFVASDLDPTMLRVTQFAGYSQSLSFAQIGQMLSVIERAERNEAGASDHLQSRIQRLERLRWSRFAIALANLIGVALALPFFLTRLPTNMVVQSLRCAPVALGAIMGGIVGSAIPVPGLPTAVSVFVPVLLLSPMLIWASSAIRS